jgi:hypothetical protein
LLIALRAKYDPRPVALKENLLAMKYTARSSGSLFIKSPDGPGFAMSDEHANALFDVEGIYFQAICACGWVSTISFLEEVDLLRALHAQGIAVYGEFGGRTKLTWHGPCG